VKWEKTTRKYSRRGRRRRGELRLFEGGKACLLVNEVNGDVLDLVTELLDLFEHFNFATEFINELIGFAKGILEGQRLAGLIDRQQRLPGERVQVNLNLAEFGFSNEELHQANQK